MTMLRRNRIITVADAIRGEAAYLHALCRVVEVHLARHIRQLKEIYRDRNLPDQDEMVRIFDTNRKQWHKVELLSSRQIRLLLNPGQCLTQTKLMNRSETQATTLYNKIAKLRNIANKTKILRLLHGDVYCGARLYRFGLSDNDRCIRCFEGETIKHLLLECPYTKEVWSRLGLPHESASDLLNCQTTQADLEILTEFISAIVFRKKVLPPEVLIRSTMCRFRDGLSRRYKTRMLATEIVNRYEITGQWFT